MSDIRELQLHQLAMFKEITEILDRENIQYFAIGGTALGAIRHNGFIPWDDDIDIGLLRPDYEKLLNISSQLPSHLILMNHLSDNRFHLLFSKIYNLTIPYESKGDRKYDTPKNIFVDFFPWDNISQPEQLKIRLKKLNKKFKRAIYRAKGNAFQKLKFWLYKPLLGFKTATQFYSEIQENISASKTPTTKTWGDVLQNDILEFDDIFPLRKVKFEDIEINVPNNCEKYLSKKYGDYMKLPPEKDRINHSGIKPT